jgi:hypothetical protein
LPPVRLVGYVGYDMGFDEFGQRPVVPDLVVGRVTRIVAGETPQIPVDRGTLEALLVSPAQVFV